MSTWSVSSSKDSERRLWVLTMETTFDSCDGLPNGCLSSGRWSLMSVRSNRGLRATSFMLLIKSKAAIGVETSSSESVLEESLGKGVRV
ncbi:hypothetical protein TorRG33x02_256260 [Trema orientale]|uniref:Uncharacterized protein n=1 Tax=Trema orientale TaxID=63057 RepID=A0A2P5DBS1_TREOI|nr:hypothetical protein TorRG33x02_256260 [Trema orientale]